MNSWASQCCKFWLTLIHSEPVHFTYSFVFWIKYISSQEELSCHYNGSFSINSYLICVINHAQVTELIILEATSALSSERSAVSDLILFGFTQYQSFVDVVLLHVLGKQ